MTVPALASNKNAEKNKGGGENARNLNGINKYQLALNQYLIDILGHCMA